MISSGPWVCTGSRNGLLLILLWATGPLRDTPGPLLRGVLEAIGGFAVVTNPSLGLLFYFAAYMGVGLVVVLAGLTETVNGLRGRLGPRGRGAYAAAGLLLAATGVGLMAAPYVTAMDFSVFIGGAALAGGIAVALQATRMGFSDQD